MTPVPYSMQVYSPGAHYKQLPILFRSPGSHHWGMPVLLASDRLKQTTASKSPAVDPVAQASGIQTTNLGKQTIQKAVSFWKNHLKSIT